MFEVCGYAAKSAGSRLEPFSFHRRNPGDNDVVIDIAYCGICHSDVHQVRDEWGGAAFPMVPGHEIAGRVSRIGKEVVKFKVGDAAGVGCLVDSCRKCSSCHAHLEQHCEGRISFTYNSTEQDGKTPTYGGYSSQIVVDEAFALKIKAGEPLEAAAPLLCAGITTYSPLKRFGARPGSRVGIVGLGGLGHMAVKIAAALGAEVFVLSGSKSKQAGAKRLGAHEFILTSDAAKMQALAGRLNLIVDTVSAKHDLNACLNLLSLEGTLALVGASPQPLEFGTLPLITGRRFIAGSLIGGIAETQEMLDFCAAKKIRADVETIAMTDVNAAYARLLKGDVRYRFSIDMKTL
ncbi:MAG TPA: NAD(P)-dependent alcohol dehydrogenase [Elusimicrobiota bacterium]|nr:NAD(P)-dependent alcohol dehydrogenase [Elusimicrobiota bacterium]